MQFNHWDLGHRNRGDIVVVNISGNAANVRLLDSSNFQNYLDAGIITTAG